MIDNTIVNQHISEEVESVKQMEPHLLYHYTSVDALYRIVKSKSIWLTSLRSSNDKMELSYSMAQFEEDLKRIRFASGNRVKDSFYRRLRACLEKNKNKVVSMTRDSSEKYAMSLSATKDNLAHWERYADSGSGVSITFNINELDLLFANRGLLLLKNSLFIAGRVLYNNTQREEMITSNLNAFWLSVWENGARISEDDIELGIMVMAVIFRKLRDFSKVSAYSDEDEYRLLLGSESAKESRSLYRTMFLKRQYALDYLSSFEDLIQKSGIEMEHFYHSRNGIRGYRELCLQEVWGKDLIPAITLGPKCTQNVQELKRFLRTAGLTGTKIVSSKVPLR